MSALSVGDNYTYDVGPEEGILGPQSLRCWIARVNVPRHITRHAALMNNIIPTRYLESDSYHLVINYGKRRKYSRHDHKHTCL